VEIGRLDYECTTTKFRGFNVLRNIRLDISQPIENRSQKNQGTRTDRKMVQMVPRLVNMG